MLFVVLRVILEEKERLCVSECFLLEKKTDTGGVKHDLVVECVGWYMDLFKCTLEDSDFWSVCCRDNSLFLSPVDVGNKL